MVLNALLSYDVDTRSFDPLDPSMKDKRRWWSPIIDVCSFYCLPEPSPKMFRAIVMRHQILLVSLTSFYFSLIYAHPFPVGSTVQTSSGAIIGHAAHSRRRVSEYLGIPYAKPPLGDLRFAAPQTYSSDQTYNASTFVSSC